MQNSAPNKYYKYSGEQAVANLSMIPTNFNMNFLERWSIFTFGVSKMKGSLQKFHNVTYCSLGFMLLALSSIKAWMANGNQLLRCKLTFAANHLISQPAAEHCLHIKVHIDSYPQPIYLFNPSIPFIFICK